MANYEFVTLWKLEASRQQVWDLILNSERWPNWWRGEEKVEKLREGRVDYVARFFAITGKANLSYRLVFEAGAVRD